jgi:hypothetical protein
MAQIVFLPQIFDSNDRLAHGKDNIPLKRNILRRAGLPVNQKPLTRGREEHCFDGDVGLPADEKLFFDFIFAKYT